MGSHSRSDDRDSSRHKHSRDRTRDEADEQGSSNKKHRSSSHRSSDHRRDRDEDDNRKHSSSSSSRYGSSRKSGSKSKSKRDDDVSNSRDRADHAAEEEDEWVEKDSSTTTQPERAPVDSVGTFSVGSMPTSTAGLRRMEPTDLTDGYGQGDVGGSNERGGGLFGGIAPSGNGTADEAADFFGSFGTERRRKEPKEKVDPAVSSRTTTPQFSYTVLTRSRAGYDGPILARAQQGVLAGSSPRERCFDVVSRCDRCCRVFDSQEWLASSRLVGFGVANDETEAHL